MKDSLSTLAMVALLVLLTIVCFCFQQDQTLVATRDSRDTITSTVLGVATPSASLIDRATSCPEGCALVEEKPTAKELLQADPVTYIATETSQKFAKQIANSSLQMSTDQDEILWWRSDKEDYRLAIPNATVVGWQVATTEKAVALTPTDINSAHPAARHPQLKKVITTVNKLMTKIGYKKSAFAQCPVNEAYDPFNNCLATYTLKDSEMRCSLIGGYSQLTTDATDQAEPYLRVELACSDQYQTAYSQAFPYLFVLDQVNPPWKIPDMAVLGVDQNGDTARVTFDQNYYGQYRRVENGYQLIDGGVKTD